MKAVTTKDLKLYEEKPDEDDFDGGPHLPLLDHLEEFRTKIIISFFALCIAASIGFFYSKDVISLLTQIAPSGTAFLQIRPGEFFFTSMTVSLYIGIALASPVIIWQLGSFILPGLNIKEKKISIPILAGAPILFSLGSLFAYFFVARSMLNFLFGFGKDIIQTSISIESFVSFSLMVMAICGVAFLLPIVIFALANVGIINSNMLIEKWRYAILLALILGALFTPTPDPFNMGLVSGILTALYFISFWILKMLRM